VLEKETKYIFITGGVLSGVGKGIAAASIGAILKARGLKVNIQKCDPYLNTDSGTLNPAEHGECFVTVDGAETDLDLGHYERFLDQDLTQDSSVMSGRILREVIDNERAGKYGGKTVQFVPHVTETMQEKIIQAGVGFDVLIVEIGGTVGDIEAQAFTEAIRELGIKVSSKNTLFAHVVYLPFLETSKEFKTKPAQNALKDIRSYGIFPELVLARSERPAPLSAKIKLALFGGITEDAIAMLPNAESIYQVPISLELQGIGNYIAQRLDLGNAKADLSKWEELTNQMAKAKQKEVTVGMVVKYVENEDSYFSVHEALRAAGWKHGVKVKIKSISAEQIEDGKLSLDDVAKEVDGILIPGGFGQRGIEGKIKAAGYALQNKIPYLGICLGMQVAAIAAARSVGLNDANSKEFNKDSLSPVITTIEGQEGKELTGGTMRLGNYECSIQPNTLAHKLYGELKVKERHRHRYEFNNDYKKDLEKAGLIISGTWQEGGLVEIIEAPDHPFYIAAQFHPEFTSRPTNPNPLFDGLIQAVI
jgi:CTP synthase